MAKPRKPGELGGLAALTLVGQVGLAVVVPIVAGVVGGLYLDGLVGGGLVLVGMIGLGITLGILGAYWVVLPYLD